MMSTPELVAYLRNMLVQIEQESGEQDPESAAKIAQLEALLNNREETAAATNRNAETLAEGGEVAMLQQMQKMEEQMRNLEEALSEDEVRDFLNASKHIWTEAIAGQEVEGGGASGNNDDDNNNNNSNDSNGGSSATAANGVNEEDGNSSDSTVEKEKEDS